MRVAAGVLMASLLLLLLAGLHPACARDSTVLIEQTFETVLTRLADCDIVINPDGSVAELKIERAVPENLRSVLDQKIRAWRFEPVMVDGQPRQAHGKMRVTLAARELPDKTYQVRVDNVTFPATVTKHQVSAERSIFTVQMSPPDYPQGPLDAGIEGIVLLALRMDIHGKVQEVMSVQSALTDVRTTVPVFNQAVRQFENAAIAAARRWRFDVKLSSGHRELRPEDLTVTVPVRYGQDGIRAAWHSELRGPRRNIEWIDAEAQTQKVGVSDLVAGELVPANGPIKLTTDVVGSLVM